MAAEIHRLRDRAGETEKITINLGYVDLGHIDLLVQEGFYSNRTDFIRTAIRNRLAAHAEEVKKSIVRHTLELGLRHFTRADLEAARAAGGAAPGAPSASVDAGGGHDAAARASAFCRSSRLPTVSTVRSDKRVRPGTVSGSQTIATASTPMDGRRTR